MAAAVAAVAGLAAAVTLGIAPSFASAGSAGSAVKVPPSLKVPRGNHLVVSLHVLQGVQVYKCGKGKWNLLEPDANMAVTGQRKPTVLYTAGPEWVSTVDGSAVWGKPVREVAEKGTIPDLLVKAVKNRGRGLFGKIDWIQRLHTSGGRAPRGGCSGGSITARAYHATEKFWAKDHKKK
jgi:Protein of unknown function (DUF3455)